MKVVTVGHSFDNGRTEWLARHLTATHEDLVDTYTCGCCGILAEALRLRLGWPVWGVFCDGVLSLRHVIVRDPDSGLFADAHGFGQTEEEILSRWKPFDSKKRWLAEVPGPTPFQHRQITVDQCDRYDLPRLFPGIFRMEA